MQMKLTDNQINVLQLMREGRRMTKTRFIGYSSVAFDSPTLFVNKNTVSGLEKKGLIRFGEKINLHSSIYELTELGKTITI